MSKVLRICKICKRDYFGEPTGPRICQECKEKRRLKFESRADEKRDKQSGN